MFSSKTPAAKAKRRTLLSGSQEFGQEQQAVFAAQTPQQRNLTKQKFENVTDSQQSQYTSEGMFYEASQTEQEVESLRSDSDTSDEYKAMKQEKLIDKSDTEVQMPEDTTALNVMTTKNAQAPSRNIQAGLATGLDSRRSKHTDFTQED